MIWVVLLLVLVAVAAVIVVMRRRQQPPAQAPAATAPPRKRAFEGPWLGPTATIRLDVTIDDPSSTSAQRLVTATTTRVFRTSPDVEEVVVEDRAGTVVARVPRQVATPGPPPTRPERETPPSKPHGSWNEPTFVPGVDQDVAVARRPLADRLDLGDAVRSQVRHPDDAVDVVRAILQAAGRPVAVSGATVRSDDDVVIVVDDTAGSTKTALSQAFLRYRETGARQGVVIHLGYVDPREVARRRALSPDLHHAGPGVLQSMADAVALGGDPIAFALADVEG